MARRPRHSGLALILVVGILTVMLVLGVAFSHTLSVEFQAAVTAREQEEARVAADIGLHQAIALLQYDVWGENEPRAFACGAGQGQLTDGTRPYNAAEVLPHMDGTVAFYHASQDGYRRITAPVSKQRRTLSRILLRPGSETTQDRPVFPMARDGVRIVENDLAWVVNYSDEYKRGGASDALDAAFPVYSAAPFHDEFLPGPLDNFDLWELRTHLNRAFNGASRDPLEGQTNGGGWQDTGWNGHYLAWPAMRRAEEFDFIDTRISGDSYYRVFRSDLVAGPAGGADAYLSFESGVDPKGVTRGGRAQHLPASPRRYLHGHAAAAEVHPGSEQGRLRFTHLGRVAQGGYSDTRGDALNLNQVNNNAADERYRDTEGRRNFYNEAKWIYVYPVDGKFGATLSRYAVTVLPENGLANANFIGPPPRNTAELTLEEAARSWGLPWYFQALDRGHSPRGLPLDENILGALKGANPPADWATRAAERLEKYVRGENARGPFSSRTELALALRKEIFPEQSGADESARSDTAAYLTGQMTVHAYENLLDAQWRHDRLIIDRGRGAAAASSFYSETAANGAQSVATRRRMAEILNELRFIYGPDDAREKDEALTPYHPPVSNEAPLQSQAAWSKAYSLAWLLSANLDPPHLGQWTSPNFPGWWLADGERGDGKLHLQMVDRKPDYAVGIKAETYEVKPRLKPEDVRYLEDGGWVGAHSWSVRINEVGRVLPKSFVEMTEQKEKAQAALPLGAAKDNWPFDGLSEYWFVELVANFSALDFPVRQRLMDDFAGNWRRHWQLLVLNESGGSALGNDVLRLPGTRVLTVDLAADPNVADNFGGDATTADFRDDKTGLNRLRLFKLDFMTSGDNAADGQRMLRPSVASFNRYTFCWDESQPKPLTLRSCASHTAQSSLRTTAWRDSMGHAHPANYMLVLFKPDELPANTTGQRIRWSCQRLNTTNDTIVLHAVDLPGNGRPFEEGWEAIDPRNCRDGRIGWKLAQAFSFADSGIMPRRPELPHSELKALSSGGIFAKFTGTPAFRHVTKGSGANYNWCDGLNAHALGHYIAGGKRNWSDQQTQGYCRYDIEDHCGARTWPFAAAHQGAATLDFYGSNAAMLQFSSDLAKVPTGWFSFIPPAQDGSEPIPDPDLRTWGDLYRVTPLEQSITAGFLGGFAWGRELRDDMFWLFPANDGLDNDLDGTIDALTAAPRDEYGPPGRYQSDRRAIGRLNLNEVSNIAGLWYAGCATKLTRTGPQVNPGLSLMTVLGRKPEKGFITVLDIATRLSRQESRQTPYDMLIWPENLYADLALSHAHAEEQYEDLANLRFSLARTLTTAHASVFTILVTAQTLDQLGEVRGEVRLRATVERTPEGRVNILEFGPQREP